MKHLIDNYRNLPGDHCGSTAMRNLLFHYCDLDLAEEVVFGLGSGIDFFYIEGKGVDPAVLTFGRSITMEADVGLALSIDYREAPDADDARAWSQVRQEVLQGWPTMLSGDVFYLDYREFKVHFPSHRFVLLGFDDESEVAYLADRIGPEPEACSYAALARSRNPSDAISTFNLWGKFHNTVPGRSLGEACELALGKSAQRMLGDDPSQSQLLTAVTGGDGLRVATGLAGLMELSRNIPGWAEREDCRWITSYASRCMETFGTGGGNFRTLYSRYLGWAREVRPDLVDEHLIELAASSARRWTELASLLTSGGKNREDRATWQEASRVAGTIAGLESELFEKLGEKTARG